MSDNKTENLLILLFVPFENHPFKLYTGKRFEDILESVRENGIIVPIIIRLLMIKYTRY